MDSIETLDATLNANGDILYLHASFVARTFYPGLGRLGLADFSAGSRGWYCERWIASSVQAENAEFIEGEGVSRAELADGLTLSLPEILSVRGERLLGAEYAQAHENRFGVLSKILDIGTPIPWHIHAGEADARKYWNCRGKEEAYYFLETPDMGVLPYSHIGVHPDVTEGDLLPLLREWSGDKVLDLSPAYRLNVNEGFHVFTGIPHAPGTALTLELQEESDVYNFLQADSYGRHLDKSLMLRGLPDEKSVIGLIDWKRSKRPDFYNAYHTVPVPMIERDDAQEAWVYHPNRTPKFSGKELRLAPGAEIRCRENGAYTLFAWKGQGEIGSLPFEAGNHRRDELFVGARTATREHAIRNVGGSELVVYKISGPGVNGK